MICIYRYTVTVGGTTLSVKLLNDRGYLKTSKQVAHDIKEKKDEVKCLVKEHMESKRKKHEEYIDAWENFSREIKEKKDNFAHDFKEKKDEVKDIAKEKKDKVKNMVKDSKRIKNWRKISKKTREKKENDK